MNRKTKKIIEADINKLKDVKFVSFRVGRKNHIRITYSHKNKLDFVTSSSTPNNREAKIHSNIIIRDIKRKIKGIY